ncbi:hypothetical protein ABT126_25865 [Streptomyces sp. NPDC002012]|uniref:hypothetical protein n=1 Tax=Streptomyces sp. NPDC002012 TaxID=3154532 RepID=UPI003318FA1C
MAADPVVAEAPTSKNASPAGSTARRHIRRPRLTPSRRSRNVLTWWARHPGSGGWCTASGDPSTWRRRIGRVRRLRGLGLLVRVWRVGLLVRVRRRGRGGCLSTAGADGREGNGGTGEHRPVDVLPDPARFEQGVRLAAGCQVLRAGRL